MHKALQEQQVCAYKNLCLCVCVFVHVCIHVWMYVSITHVSSRCSARCYAEKTAGSARCCAEGTAEVVGVCIQMYACGKSQCVFQAHVHGVEIHKRPMVSMLHPNTIFAAQ